MIFELGPEIDERFDCRKAIWIAELSDGRTAYQTLDKDWASLKALCEAEKVRVKRLRLRFRSHHVDFAAPLAENYWLINGFIVSLGGGVQHTINVGVPVGDKMVVRRWRTPELEPFDTEIRELDFSHPCWVHDEEKD